MAYIIAFVQQEVPFYLISAFECIQLTELTIRIRNYVFMVFTSYLFNY